MTETKKPLVSVVLTCLNTAGVIERTILSVLNQTYKNIEFIIIDGGSTDGTVDIIKKYKDQIAYWVSQKDKGTYSGFNKGIKKSRGELIGILDAGDCYEPDVIETVIKIYRKNPADFYFGATRHWESESKSFITLPDPNYERKVKYRMPKMFFESGFIKRSVYEEIGLYNENLVCIGDYDMLRRMVENGKKSYLINKVITSRDLGGITDVRADFAYWELFSSTSDKFRGFLWFLYSLLKFYLRKAIGFLPGSGKIIHFIRKVKYQ